MNDRIKQLAEQAGWDNHHSKFDTRIEKFAELIVKECVDIVSGTAVDTPPNDLFYGYNLGVNKAAENIKERFGVEE